MTKSIERINSDSSVFWAEMTPCEHLVQIYEDDEAFLNTLEGFIADGLQSGDGVVVIATAPHIKGLGERLELRGIDVDAARKNDTYVVLDADETLPRFIDNGWPNDDRFHELIKDVLARARGNNRRVRAFGELVAVLWGNGHSAATVRLEHLWHNLCRDEDFALFCAYPKIGFTDFAIKSLEDICSVHSRVIA